MLGEMRSNLDRLKAKRQILHQKDQAKAGGKLLSFYARIMSKVTESERCSVFIHDPENDKVWLKVGTGVDERGIEVPTADSIVGKVISSGEPIVVSNLEDRSGVHKTVDDKTGFVTRNILCVPIKSPSRGEVTGAIQILNKVGGQEFEEDDISLAQEIAEHLQLEVESIFLDQEIFGLTEKLYSTATTTMKYLIVSVVLVVALSFLYLLGWGISGWIFE